MLSCVILFVLAGFFLLWSYYRTLDDKKFATAATVISGLAVVFIFGWMVVNNWLLLKDSDVVAQFNVNSLHATNLFYDKTEDVYYILEQNTWNFIEPQSKRMISNEDAKEYIALIEKIKN